MSDSSLEIELQHRLEQFQSAPQGRAFAPLADCYRRMGRYDDARRVCETGLEHHPTYVSAHVILGRIYHQQGHEARARSTFEKVLELDPQNLTAMRYLAHTAERRGDVEAAIEYWRQVETFDPQDTGARARRERMEAERGIVAPVALERLVDEPETLEEPASPEEAEAPEESEEFGPVAPPVIASPAPAASGAPIATVTLADIYYEQGFKAKALEIYRSLQREAPGTPGVDERVQRIEQELSDLQQRLEATRGGGPAEASLETLARSMAPEAPPTAAAAREPRPDVEASEWEDEDDFDHFRTWLGRIKTRPF